MGENQFFNGCWNFSDFGVIDAKVGKKGLNMSKEENTVTLIEALDEETLMEESIEFQQGDFETMEDSEMSCMGTEEVITTEETVETIIPDMEPELSSIAPMEEKIIHSAALVPPSQMPTSNVVFQTKPTLQRVPLSIQVIWMIAFSVLEKEPFFLCFTSPGKMISVNFEWRKFGNETIKFLAIIK